MLDTQSEKKIKLKKLTVKLNYDNAKWKEVYSDYHKTMLLFITTSCQLNCPKCFCLPERIAIKKEISLETIEKIIKNNPIVDKYDIMGGEPSLHSNFLDILNLFEKNNKKIGLYTNALLLSKLPTDYKNLKINMAFHSIESSNSADKPISKSIVDINHVMKYYPVKIVFLMNEDNKNNLFKFVDYCEKNIPLLSKITIGAIRDESDYYNDDIKGIIPLQEYANIIQDFIDNYKGNLNVDIFPEGILYTDNLPENMPNQINRFKSVFPENDKGEMVYADCLYDIGIDNLEVLPETCKLEYKDFKTCPKTGKTRCITDKIKLVNINNITKK
ncbi:MAG: 4Fe-4S cluster-binding domain-containing protein [Alphaproteobacteria bacterium]|nr:4Fe-4S cluster-binding domain-containing protein [Alphaproteobacteria bacterium]